MKKTVIDAELALETKKPPSTYKGKYEQSPHSLLGQIERYLEASRNQVELGNLTYARHRQTKWAVSYFANEFLKKNKHTAKAEHLVERRSV